MNNKERYHIKIDKNRLVFTTAFFRAEIESVLHKGVYTSEFSSMLTASLAGAFTFLAIKSIVKETGFITILIIILVFISAFLGSRKFVFCDRVMRVVIDKCDKSVTIYHPGLFRNNPEKIPMQMIQGIYPGSRKFTPDNPDGIRFVEKISLQHGSYMPGLGEEREFITLSFKLSDNTERLIYAVRIEEEPDIPLKEIEQFLSSGKVI